MLEISNLCKVYGDGSVGVDNLDLSIPKGEIFVLLGPNGAGKTSTIMLILGFTEPTSGTVKVNGIDVQKDPLEAKKHIAYVSENVMLYANFTARQNIDFFTRLGGRSDMSDDDYVAAFRRVGLGESSYHRRVRGFSKGMRQRLGIAIAILKNAELITLDEPTSGLDPKGGFQFLKVLRRLKGEGKTILMSSHDIFRAKDIADRVGIMSHGKIVEIIDRERLDHADLQDVYLKYVKEADAGGTSVKAQ